MLRKPRGGFSLVEALVIFAIIGILIGLLLPAIHRIRDIAARTQCQNNLKQVGSALHHYHSTNSVLPQGAMFEYPYYYWSWMAQILPYAEQEPLYKEANEWALGNKPFSWWPWGDFWTGWATTPPNPAVGTPVKAWTCPMDGRILQATDADGMTIAYTSMLGVSGTGNNANDGVLYWKSRVRLIDIRDGTGQTLMVGERPPSAEMEFGWWFAGAGYNDLAVGDVFLGARETAFATALTCPDSKVGYQPGTLKNTCDQSHFWSLHTGGGNFLMADGSARFLTYAADSVLPQLATRAGGESIGDY
jgi:prepilin-type processing-associated H-X9-DG protein